MLIEVGILFGVYIGVRLFEKPQKSMGTQPFNKSQKLPAKAVIKESSTVLPIRKLRLNKIPTHKKPSFFNKLGFYMGRLFSRSSLKSQAALEETVANDIDKRHNHYIKLSTVSLGLTAIRQFHPALQLLSLSFIIYTAFPIFKSAEKSLVKEKRFSNDVLNSTIICLCLASGQYFASTLFIWFYPVGQKWLAKSKDHSQKMLTQVFEQLPSRVWVLKDQVEIEMPLSEVSINDIVVVNTGNVIPIDGIIIEGEAMIDQHALTGESQPAEKGPSDKVFASTVIVTGKIQIKVENTGTDTTVSKLGNILNHLVDFKTNTQLKGEKWADKAVIPHISLSALAWLIGGYYSAIAVLCNSFGNNLTLLASFGTFNHLSLASWQGILVKDGRALEMLNTVDTVLFDKTGTLTKEQPEIGKIVLCDEYGEDQVLIYAAAAERQLTHPIAKAILQKAKESKLTLPDIEDSQYKIGYGITVSIENKLIRVGSERFMTLAGFVLPTKIEEAMAYAHTHGHSLVMVAVNQKVIGAIEIQAVVRPEVKNIISDLRDRGIKQIAIVSGDHKQPTQKLAKYLDMDSYFYDILPENKAQIVEQLQKEGKVVCFVGDGLNDSIAMKKANVSISLRGASSIATDLAQVVLMDGSLSHLCEVFDISKRLDNNLQNSFAITLVSGAFNIGGVFLSHFGVIAAIIINNGGFFVGLGNAMFPLRKLKKNEKTEKLS
jgi:heavy metal translocating P-type ATPase